MDKPPDIGRVVWVEGLPVHYLSRGSGHPILLLHGNGSLGEEILSPFPLIPGIRWIAPDRPGYGLTPPLPGTRLESPVLAAWLEGLMNALGIARAAIVAHSLSAGAALCLAARLPERVARLVLLAPFCRPTPQRAMIGLRLANAPVIGPAVRRFFLPLVAPLAGPGVLAGMSGRRMPPPWLASFPFRHAAQPQAVRTMAAELLHFNGGMKRVEQRLHLRIPVSAIWGTEDETSDPAWHLPWLADRTEALDWALLHGIGHAPHHAVPALVVALATGGTKRRRPAA